MLWAEQSKGRKGPCVFWAQDDGRTSLLHCVDLLCAVLERGWRLFSDFIPDSFFGLITPNTCVYAHTHTHPHTHPYLSCVQVQNNNRSVGNRWENAYSIWENTHSLSPFWKGLLSGSKPLVVLHLEFCGRLGRQCVKMSLQHLSSTSHGCCSAALGLPSNTSLCKWKARHSSPKEHLDSDEERQTINLDGPPLSLVLPIPYPSSESFPVGINLIAIAALTGWAIFLEACVSFKLMVLQPKSPVVISENFSPLLRKGPRWERKKVSPGLIQEEPVNRVLKKSRTTWA